MFDLAFARSVSITQPTFLSSSSDTIADISHALVLESSF